MSDALKNFFALLPGTYRSVLCLNGELPSAEFFKNISLPIIAADGAYNQLAKINIIPEFAIGDGDSIQHPIDPRCTWFQVENKNNSDFEKALKLSEEKNLSPSIVVGLNGGNLDHILHNIEIFSQTDCIGFSCHQMIVNLKKQQTFRFEKNTKLSLFGAPECRVTTHGLRWELNDYKLQFSYLSSCFNRTVFDEILINVQSGHCLLMVYLDETLDKGSDLFINKI